MTWCMGPLAMGPLGLEVVALSFYYPLKLILSTISFRKHKKPCKNLTSPAGRERWFARGGALRARCWGHRGSGSIQDRHVLHLWEVTGEVFLFGLADSGATAHRDAFERLARRYLPKSVR